MPGAKVYPKADDLDVTVFIEKNFKKLECNRFRKELKQDDIEVCKCGYTKTVHSDEALRKESKESEPCTIAFPTDAFGKLVFAEEEDSEWKTKLKSIRYIRLDYETDINLIRKLFRVWKLAEPQVILSVLSDSGHHGKIETTEPVEKLKKTIASVVEAAVSTNAWLITGGLNQGIDQLIGDEVKQRLINGDKIPKVLLGISNWGRLEEKKTLLSAHKVSGANSYADDSNKTGLYLNRHHTHLLLADDGTQKSSCECALRKSVELSMAKTEPTENGNDMSTQLIYFLIGGSINSVGVVERALTNRIPVVVFKGTGGIADIISADAAPMNGPAIKCLPEIFDKLFRQLKEFLIAKEINESVVQNAIDGITTGTKLQPFLDIVELLGHFSEGDAVKFRDEIAPLVEMSTARLLEKIKSLISENISPDNSSHSTELHTAKRMMEVIELMLIGNGIPMETAKQAVDSLEPDILHETLTNVKHVHSNLRAIRTHNQRDLLIEFDISSTWKEAISRLIVEVLKKVKRSKPCDVYLLVAEWNNEKFFKQLLQENWMRDDHKYVFLALLKKDKTRYLKLMIENVSNSSWLTSPSELLADEMRKNKMCAFLLKTISDKERCKDGDDQLPRLRAKNLFIWCMHKQMPETSMLFWKQGQDGLAMALVAYHILKKQRNEMIDEDGFDKMEQQLQYFSELALDLLRRCYTDNRKNTHDLLVGKVEDIEDLTPLQLAVDADFNRFISEAPVQKLLDKIWIKNIENHSKGQYVPILCSAVCPFVAPVLLDFRIPTEDINGEENHGKRVKTNEFLYRYFRKLKNFINTPLVKFFYSFICYIGYLILFSIVLLTDFRGQISSSEIALAVWTFILIIEEVKQPIVLKHEYKFSEWLYFDIGAMTMYIIGFILRMIYHGDRYICPNCLYVARIVLAFSLMIFFFRTFRFLSIKETLGPKIYMLRGLLSEFISFLLILTVFISAYGVVSNAILYPNQPLNGKLLQDVFYDAWWSVIQQFNREDALGLNCNVDTTTQHCSSSSYYNPNYVWCKDNRCPANTWIVSVLLAFYALLTVVMMLNLLIAMVNTAFSTANEWQKQVSKMQRYRLIREYSSRSMVPPPLCVITYPFVIIKYVYHLCINWLEDDEDDDHSQADGENQEFPPNDQDHTVVRGNPNSKMPRLFKSPNKAFAKSLNSRVKDWEQVVIEEYLTRNKDLDEGLGTRVTYEKERAGMASETTTNFDETQLIGYAIKQIREKIMKEKSYAETDKVNQKKKNKKSSSKDKEPMQTSESTA